MATLDVWSKNCDQTWGDGHVRRLPRGFFPQLPMRGRFALSDALDSIARQCSDQTDGYGVLVDLRFLNGEPTIDEVRRILVACILRKPVTSDHLFETVRHCLAKSTRDC
jgi:hypothetical protein